MPKYYFISDVHLGTGDPATDRKREDRLVAVLERIRDEASRGEAAALFIVGDLFDSWFEFRRVIPKRHIRTLASLANIRKIIPVEYLMGNHDFGHRNYFERDLNIPIHSGDIERTLNGKKFYIAHGDGKALNDTGYLILRKILRNKFLLWCYSWIHPDIGISVAEKMSGSSRAYTDQRDALQKQDGLRIFAEKKLAEGFDYVVMGHRHRPEVTPFAGGTYINLGDWLGSYSFGVFDGSDFRLETAPETP
ncbi:MAG TPA: UDP-2,3-diacylglucosamine diphosphatase [Candidatus Kapabacteria bacterium]|nr:UDP-2,3-diacylglucosamine diphosphatase [Candidatus Kapabacteria bacterium]